jgi:hypothetical protein
MPARTCQLAEFSTGPEKRRRFTVQDTAYSILNVYHGRDFLITVRCPIDRCIPRRPRLFTAVEKLNWVGAVLSGAAR